MGLESLKDYVYSNRSDLIGIPWIPVEYPRARQVFLQNMIKLGIDTVSEDNRIFYGNADEFFTFKMPLSEKSQVFTNLFSLFEIHKDVAAQPITSKTKLSKGWYIVWPNQVDEGTTLQTLKETNMNQTWDTFEPPMIIYYYDTGHMILLNPYLERFDLERIRVQKFNQRVFFNPTYRYTDLRNYNSVGGLFYLGFDLFGISIKTLNYPHLRL